MTVATDLSRFCWYEPAYRSRAIEQLTPDELFALTDLVVRDNSLPGAGEFADAVAYCRTDVPEEVLLSLVSSTGLFPNPDVLTHRPDVTERVATSIAVHVLMSMVRGTQMGTFSIFSHPLLPSWVMGVAYKLTMSKRFAGTITGGTFSSRLSRNQAFPLLAKAKLHSPEHAAVMVGTWVEKTPAGHFHLLPHLDVQVRDQYPDLADLPVKFLLDVLHHQPLPDGFWAEVPKLYEPLVAAYILVDDEEEDEVW